MSRAKMKASQWIYNWVVALQLRRSRCAGCVPQIAVPAVFLRPLARILGRATDATRRVPTFTQLSRPSHR
eukprot:3851871-Pyramimonas_sp.AAC.1